MKTETSHEIKSTDQPARQQINHTNQLQTLCNQSNNMPALNLPSSIYKLNNPRLSQLYILIYQMTSNVIRLAMIGYRPTIKNHQNQG